MKCQMCCTYITSSTYNLERDEARQHESHGAIPSGAVQTSENRNNMNINNKKNQFCDKISQSNTFTKLKGVD